MASHAAMYFGVIQCLGSGYMPTPTLSTLRSAYGLRSAFAASAIAYRVGLFAQYPPSNNSTVIP